MPVGPLLGTLPVDGNGADDGLPNLGLDEGFVIGTELGVELEEATGIFGGSVLGS